MIKQIMIPVVAFAVTVTGVSAFNSDILEKLDINLTDTQIEALEEAHELRRDGADRAEIKEMLEDVGISRETMKEIHTAMRQHRGEVKEAIKVAIKAEDYEAYQNAVADTPHADIINSEDDFNLLVEAHKLREAGNYEGAWEIMSELGFEKRKGFGKKGNRHGQKKQ